jgi:hypothetical protein
MAARAVILLSRDRKILSSRLRLARRDCSLVAVEIRTCQEGRVDLHDETRTGGRFRAYAAALDRCWVMLTGSDRPFDVFWVELPSAEGREQRCFDRQTENRTLSPTTYLCRSTSTEALCCPPTGKVSKETGAVIHTILGRHVAGRQDDLSKRLSYRGNDRTAARQSR